MSLYVITQGKEVLTAPKEYTAENVQGDLVRLKRDPKGAPKSLTGPTKLGALTIMPAVVDTPEYDEATQVLIGRYREILSDKVRYYYNVEEKPDDVGEEEELV